MLFLATAINYMDRQVLSLTWKDFISPEFGWNDTDYGLITGCFSIVYAIAMLVVASTVCRAALRLVFQDVVYPLMGWNIQNLSQFI